jgi:flagellar biosynthesis/type III secretory pathway protein FliH
MSVYRHSAPSQSSGILFAEDFDLPDALPALTIPDPEPEPVAPVYTSEQLADACAEAYAEGRRAALEDAVVQHRRACSVSLEAIAERLAAAMESAEAAMDETVQSTAKLIMTTLWVLLPETCSRHESVEVTGLVRHLMKDMSPFPAVEVSVSPVCEESVRTEMQSLPTKLRKQVRVIGDEDLAEGETEVTWKTSKAIRSRSRALSEIEAALRKFDLLTLPEAGAAAPDDTADATAKMMEQLNAR